MSKLKTPREKKLASLALDRRTVYGENAKASRKAIPSRKQMSHQLQRRAASKHLAKLPAQIDAETADNIEANLIETDVRSSRKAFKKSPDAPLAICLESKQTGDWIKTNRSYWLPNRRPS